MKLYTYSTARQRLAEVLEEASREGEVQIRRQDGRVYAVTPVARSTQSPFANVTGRAVRGCDVQGSTPKAPAALCQSGSSPRSDLCCTLRMDHLHPPHDRTCDLGLQEL